MPALLSDINGRMEPRGVEGKMEPFKDNYDVVFQIIVRMASCQELATSPRSIQIMNDLYWKLEKSTAPVNLLLP